MKVLESQETLNVKKILFFNENQSMNKLKVSHDRITITIPLQSLEGLNEK